MFYVVWRVTGGAAQSAAFETYMDAEDYLCTLPVALHCDWKYIDRGCD